MEQPFFDPTRIKFVMAGERAGKSFHGALQLVARHKFGNLFWIVAEEYETCVPEFEYVVRFLTQLHAIDFSDPKAFSNPKEGSKSIRTKDGVLIETRSADDYKRVAEKAPDGILGCEAGRWGWQTFLRVSGRLAERRGWAWISGSFEGSMGWQAEKFRQWQGPNLEQARSWGLPSWSNTYVFPKGEADPEIERLRVSQPADYFSERYGGVPVPPSGRVYYEFEYASHVSELAEYQPGKPVEVWVDPGHSGAYCVLAAQCIGDTVNIVDEVYVQRLTNSEVINLCQKRRWWPDHETRGVIDIAGRGHMGERSPFEAWQEDAGIHLESAFVHINDGLSRVRSFLKYDSLRGRPGLLVSPRCVGLIAEMGSGKHPIEGMGAYRYKTDSRGTVVSEKPIDLNNHACSALAYGLVARYGVVKHTFTGPANWREPSGESYNWVRQSEGHLTFEDVAARHLENQRKRQERDDDKTI